MSETGSPLEPPPQLTRMKAAPVVHVVSRHRRPVFHMCPCHDNEPVRTSSTADETREAAVAPTVVATTRHRFRTGFGRCPRSRGSHLAIPPAGGGAAPARGAGGR